MCVRRVLNWVVTNFNQNHSITQSSLSKHVEIMARESPSWQRWTGGAKKDKSSLVLLCVEAPLMNGFNKDLIDCSGARQANKHLWPWVSHLEHIPQGSYRQLHRAARLTSVMCQWRLFIMHWSCSKSNLRRKWNPCIFSSSVRRRNNHFVLQSGAWEMLVPQSPGSSAGFPLCPGVNLFRDVSTDISALLCSGHRQKQRQIQGRRSHKNTN